MEGKPAPSFRGVGVYRDHFIDVNYDNMRCKRYLALLFYSTAGNLKHLNTLAENLGDIRDRDCELIAVSNDTIHDLLSFARASEGTLSLPHYGSKAIK